MHKFLTEILPLILFFITYKFYDLVTATAVIIGATLLGIIYSYITKQPIAKTTIFSTVILVIFGGATIISGNPQFFKMKPTILYSLFSMIILGGLYYKKGVLKFIFDSQIKMSDENWCKFSARFAILFIILAFLNEFIWRSYSEEIWVKFKVFGFLPIIIIFTLANIPFLLRHSQQNKS